jgi:hypothetical protein
VATPKKDRMSLKRQQSGLLAGEYPLVEFATWMGWIASKTVKGKGRRSVNWLESLPDER